LSGLTDKLSVEALADKIRTINVTLLILRGSLVPLRRCWYPWKSSNGVRFSFYWSSS